MRHPSALRKGNGLEEVPCDLCRSRAGELCGSSYQDGSQALICRRCGLIYISPRMTKAWYDRYYQEEYRRIEGGLADLDTIFEKARTHGRALATLFRRELADVRRLIEVGSSVGGVLDGFRDELGCAVWGVEPSEREAAYAEVRGIPTMVSAIEDLETSPSRMPRPDAILSV